MKLKISVILVGILFSFHLSAQKVMLFNGKNLDNWYAFEPSTGKHANPYELFGIEKCMIRLHGKRAGYLMSKQSFENFKLTAEYRWNLDTVKFEKKSIFKNSGIMYLVPDTAKDMLWCTGIQFQIKQDYTGDFIFLNGVTAEIDGKRTTAGKSMIYARKADAEKPFGKWNKIEIMVQNGVVTQKLNGKIVNQAQNPSVKSGRILLQYEGYPIDFRQIAVTRL